MSSLGNFHYRIDKKLGQGGMGEVYKAFDIALDRPVALKILPTALVGEEDRVRRFIQEAKAASALNHPHIVTIYEIGQVAPEALYSAELGELKAADVKAIYYIAMEYIDGETLRDRLRLESPDLKPLLEHLVQVAEGLAKAHSSGIIHRDLKPDNIMITHEGYVKILDFGLAKLSEPRQASNTDSNEEATAVMENKTQPGAVMGTAGYMSPEQAQGRTVDHRSDIFSFGCVLYEAVTGHKPFAGDSFIDTLHKIVYSQPPEVIEFKPDAPAELQRIIKKCLAKDVEERYQSIKDVALDLRQLLRESQGDLSGYHTQSPVSRAPVSHAPTSAPLRPLEAAATVSGGRGVLIGVIVAVVIALGAITALVVRFSGPPPAAPTATKNYFESIKVSKLTNSGKAMISAVSPDGKYAVYAVEEAGKQSLWMRQVAINSNVQIVPPAEVGYFGLAFSKDGNYIYYTQRKRGEPVNELFQMPVLGGTAKKLIHDISSPVTFSPDGSSIAFVRFYPNQGESALMLANADGSGERRLTARKLPDQYGYPAWSPDGKTVACSAVNVKESFFANVVAVEIASAKEQPIGTQRWIGVDAPVWLPDGSGLIFSATDQPSKPQQIYALSYPMGVSRAITNDLNNYSDVSLTADASALVAIKSDLFSNLWAVPMANVAQAKQITSGAIQYMGTFGLCYTPDGRIVYGSSASGNTDIWIMDADGSNQKQLTDGNSINVEPTVSADGRYIIFTSNRAGTVNLWRMDIDGSNLKQLTNGKAEVMPQATPDGKWIIYVSVTERPMLWKLPVEGGAPIQLTKEYSTFPAISPDGRYFSCLYMPDPARRSTAVFAIEGGEPVKSFPNVRGRARWSADSKSLLFVDNKAGVSNVWRQPIEGGEAVKVTDFQADLIFSFDLSRDGKNIVCSRGIVSNDLVLISSAKN